MIEYSAETPITDNYILKRISQEDIFEYYLGISVRTNYIFKSPLRKDNNPTCSFTYLHDGTLLYRDWAWSRPHNCFQIVKEIFNLNYHQALHKIADDFDLADSDINVERVKEINLKHERINNDPRSKREKSIIEVKVLKNYQPEVLKYFNSFGISKSTLSKFNVLPINHVWLNGTSNWIYSSSDPAIGYYFGLDSYDNQKWKIYFYSRDGVTRYPRFICNTNRINGWVQYRNVDSSSDLVIITKSMKDVMSLYELGYSAIAMQNETTIPYDEIVDELYDHADKVVSLYDNDTTGMRTAYKIEEIFGIKPIFLEEEKDISDLIRSTSKQYAKKTLESLIK